MGHPIIIACSIRREAMNHSDQMNFYGKFPPLFCSDLRNLRFYSESDGAAGENFGNLVQFSIGFCLRNRDFNSLKPQKFSPAAPKSSP